MRNSESFPIITIFPSNMSKQRYVSKQQTIILKAWALTMETILYNF